MEVDFPKFTKVVANFPFRVALPLIFKIMDNEYYKAILVCKERLARRITAKPGDRGYSRVGVQIARRTNSWLLSTVPKNRLFPPPDVDTALLRLESIPAKFKVPNESFSREVLKFLFALRERTVGKSLNTLKAFSILTQRIIKARRFIGEGILRKRFIQHFRMNSAESPEFSRTNLVIPLASSIHTTTR